LRQLFVEHNFKETLRDMGWRHLLLICHYTPSTFRVYVVKWEEDDAKHDSLPELVVPDGDAVPEEKHLEYANAAVCQERRAAQTYQAESYSLSLGPYAPKAQYQSCGIQAEAPRARDRQREERPLFRIGDQWTKLTVNDLPLVNLLGRVTSRRCLRIGR